MTVRVSAVFVSAVAANTVATAFAECPVGAKVISGGFDAGAESEIFISRFHSDGNRWGATVFNLSTTTADTFTPFAVCAAP